MILFSKLVASVVVAICVRILFKIWMSRSVQEWRENRKRFAEAAARLPGPRSLPLIGNALTFTCGPEEILSRILEMGGLYEKPFRWWLGPQLYVGIKKPGDIKKIMLSAKAAQKDSSYRFAESLFGRGLLTSSGPIFKTHRKVILALLNQSTTNSFVEYFDKHSRRFCEQIDPLVGTGDFDVYPYMELCAVNSASDAILGTSGNMEEKQRQELSSHIKRMYQLVIDRMFKVWLQPDFIYSFTRHKNLQDESQNVIRQFVANLVALKKKKFHTSQTTPEISGTPELMLLDQLIAQNERTGLMDDGRLAEEILTIYIAGEDSTTVTCSSVLLMLAMYPEIQERVRTELFEVLGEEGVTAENLPKLKYLNMVIKETLRLLPLGPILLRKLTGDVYLESCKIPKGCSVTLMPFLTHRDPEYWQNPNEFNPDRFKPENSIDRHPYAYVPFSGGIRSCVGKEYAKLYIKTVVVNVLKKYRLKSNCSLDGLKLKTDIVLRSVHGYRISITRV